MSDSSQRDNMPCEPARPDQLFAQEAINRAVRMCDEARVMNVEADEIRNHLLSQREQIGRFQDQQRISALTFFDRYFLQEDDYSAVLSAAIEAALRLIEADRGNLQLLDPTRGSLHIEAQWGFDKPFLDFFEYVHDGQAACGIALARGERVVVEDVTKSPIFVGKPALDVMIEAGVRAVQSSPLIGSNGKLLGVFSAHYHKPKLPSERELRMFDLLACRAARWIELKMSRRRYRS